MTNSRDDFKAVVFFYSELLKPNREAVIVTSLNDALRRVCETSSRQFSSERLQSEESHNQLSGLVHCKASAQILCAGTIPFLRLGNYYKTCIFSSPPPALTPDRDSHECGDHDNVESIVWSAINTSRCISLGRETWRTMQMLPFPDSIFQECPPLLINSNFIDQKASESFNVVLINHSEPTGVVDLLRNNLAQNQKINVHSIECSSQSAFSDENFVAARRAHLHVHIGYHTDHSEQLRIIDSWRSGIPVIQMTSKRNGRAVENARMIDDGVSGLLTHSDLQTLNAISLIHSNIILRNTLREGGRAYCVQLKKSWDVLARELLV